MLQRRSLGWPITLGVIMIVLVVAVTIGWVIITVASAQSAQYWWALLAVGATLLGLILVGVVLYLMISVKEISLNQRQSNFIASVTHELKSPIASLKLYLQTLSRRSVPEHQQADFYRAMLDDLNRLDTLINHMLDAARLDEAPRVGELENIDLAQLLEQCARAACQNHRLPPESIELDVSPAIVRARLIDLEMLFRNLIDNAIKYGGTVPHVEIHSHPNERGMVVTQIIDNGEGIPPSARRRIFGRFVRLGNELERSKPGTGLGLFIVRTVVRRLRGKISVRNPVKGPGSVFEVELPVVSVPTDGARAAVTSDGKPLGVEEAPAKGVAP